MDLNHFQNVSDTTFSCCQTAVGAPRPIYYALTLWAGSCASTHRNTQLLPDVCVCRLRVCTMWAGLGVGSDRAALGQSAHQSFPRCAVGPPGNAVQMRPTRHIQAHQPVVLPQVCLCPAWKCVPRVKRRSHPDTPTRSFPSGHSSTAAAGLTCVAVILLDDLRLLATVRRAHRVQRAGRLPASAPGGVSAAPWTVLVALTAASFVVAVGVTAWVGVTRIIDHWHFSHDVLAGWLLGVVTAYACVVLLYPAYGAVPVSGMDMTGRGRAEQEDAWAAAARSLLVGGGSATEVVALLAVAPAGPGASTGAYRDIDSSNPPLTQV